MERARNRTTMPVGGGSCIGPRPGPPDPQGTGRRADQPRAYAGRPRLVPGARSPCLGTRAVRCGPQRHLAAGPRRTLGRTSPGAARPHAAGHSPARRRGSAAPLRWRLAMGVAEPRRVSGTGLQGSKEPCSLGARGACLGAALVLQAARSLAAARGRGTRCASRSKGCVRVTHLDTT